MQAIIMTQIADPDRLKWIAVPGTAEGEWQRTRQLLSDVLRQGDVKKIYHVRRNAVYRADVPELGPIAIKVATNKRLDRRIKERFIKPPRTVGEFYTTATFWKRGGRVPRPLALATEYSLFGIRRVFVFLEWIENTVTLAEYIRDQGHPANRKLWQCVAEAMVDCANKGLVHGGQNPDNILIAEQDGERIATVIDIAQSRLHDRMNERGFVNDVVRLGCRLESGHVCSKKEVDKLFKVVAKAAWADKEERRHWKDKMLARQRLAQ